MVLGGREQEGGESGEREKGGKLAGGERGKRERRAFLGGENLGIDRSRQKNPDPQGKGR